MANILNADTGEIEDISLRTDDGRDAVAATIEVEAMRLEAEGEEEGLPYEEVFVSHEAYEACDDELLLEADFVMGQDGVDRWRAWAERERRIWDAMDEQGIDSMVPEMPGDSDFSPEALQEAMCGELGIDA